MACRGQKKVDQMIYTVPESQETYQLDTTVVQIYATVV